MTAEQRTPPAAAKPNRPPRAARRPLGMVGVLLAGTLVVAGGWVYRSYSERVQANLDAEIQLDPPLSSLALTIGDWRGRDVPIPEAIQRIAGNDDFVNRVYAERATDATVSLYVGYTARPRTMLRHRPTVCYPSAGHTQTGAQQVTLQVGDARYPAMVYTFFRPGISEQRTLVMNYYVLVGEVTIDEHSFWSLNWRDPNFARDATRYVAQVQIAADLALDESQTLAEVQRFAETATPALLELLPGAGGAADGDKDA